ncbi:hypothetical protein O988_09688, partial [Pseudogymnoascus sp. VKM F-3808]
PSARPARWGDAEQEGAGEGAGAAGVCEDVWDDAGAAEVDSGGGGVEFGGCGGVEVCEGVYG